MTSKGKNQQLLIHSCRLLADLDNKQLTLTQPCIAHSQSHSPYHVVLPFKLFFLGLTHAPNLNFLITPTLHTISISASILLELSK